MRVGRLLVVVQLDVVELRAADHPLLLGHRQRFPRRHVVDVFLHVHIAAAGEVGILVADRGGADRERAVRVLGAVDEPEQIAVVEEPEAVHLVDHGDRAGHRVDELAGQLEADVHRLGPDVEQQVARGGRRAVARAVERDERVQLGRPRTGEQPVPGVGADRGDHREPLGGIAKADRPHQSRDVGQRIVHGRLAAFVDRRHQEDGRGRQRRQNRLRLHSGHRLTLTATSTRLSRRK